MANAAHASGLLVRSVPITFAHDLLRESLLTTLSPAERRRWHTRWADVLEQLGGNGAAAAIARHVVASGEQADGVRAATWAGRAAMAAAVAGAWEEEADLRRLAFTALHRVGAPAAEQVEAEVALATALYRAGFLSESVAVSGSAVESAVAAGLWDVATSAAGIVTGVDDVESRAALDRMATSLLARPEITERDRARLLVQQAFHRSGAMSPAEDIRLGEQALAVARSAGDPLATLEACRLLVAVPRPASDLEQRVRLADEAIAAARQLGDPLSLMWPVLWRIEALLVLGRPFRQETAALVTLAEECRLPLVRWHALRQQAALAAAEGRMAAAHAHHAAASAIARQIGDGSAIGLGQAFFPTVMALLGVAEPLSAEEERTLLRAPRDNFAVIGGHAWRLAGAGRMAEARALLEELRGLFDVAAHDGRTEGGITLGLLTAIRLGDRRTTEALRDALARCAPADGGHGTPSVVFAGAIANTIGAANEGLGNLTLAIDDYELAVGVDTRTGLTVALVQAHLGAARCLLARGEPGDADRAAGDLGRASVWLEEMEVETLSAELRRLQGLAATGTEPGGLSPRERQVAALVAEGLSNRQIAERLVLSERTVESHMRNALIKLDFSRREEIVAWVVRQEVRP
jgi:DNA-binding CsgD family transcriptional regulator